MIYTHVAIKNPLGVRSPLDKPAWQPLFIGLIVRVGI